MKTEIKDDGNQIRNSRKSFIIAPDVLLRYLIADDEEIDTIIMCKSSEIELATSDLALYEALCSIKPRDNFRLNKLVKLVEVVDIVSQKKQLQKEKPIVKEERVEELRNKALKQDKK